MKHTLAIQVARYNKAMDRLDTTDVVEVARISNRLTWYYRFHKLPDDLMQALMAKFTKILSGEWYEDAHEETVIKKYLY